jgi:hypothetical protein
VTFWGNPVGNPKRRKKPVKAKAIEATTVQA